MDRQECQIGSWKPYPLPVRAKNADNHWLVYFANELDNSVLGVLKLEKNCSQSAQPFFFFFLPASLNDF